MKKWLKETKEMLTNPIVLAFLIFIFTMVFINTKLIG